MQYKLNEGLIICYEEDGIRIELVSLASFFGFFSFG